MSELFDTILQDTTPVATAPEQPLAEVAYATNPENPVEAARTFAAVPKQDVAPLALGTIREQTIKETRQALISNYTTENLEAFSDSIKNEFYKPPRVVISERALENLAISSVEGGDGGRSKDAAEAFLTYDLPYGGVLSNFDTLRNQEELHGSSSFGTAFQGMLVQGFAPSTQILGLVAKELLGKQYVLNYGNLIRDLAAQDPAKVLEVFNKVTKDWLGVAGQSRGKDNTWTEAERERNDFIMYQFMDDLAKYRKGEVGNGEHLVNNLMGWVDAMSILPPVAAAKIVSKAFRASTRAIVEGRVLPNTFLGKAFSVNPDLAAKVAGEAVLNPNFAAALGTIPTKIVSSTLPQALTRVSEDLLFVGAPKELVNSIKKVFESVDEAIKWSPNTHLHSDKTWYQAMDESAAILKDTQGGMDIHLGSTAIGRDFNDNIVRFQAIYGRGSRGYRSVEEAGAALSKNIDSLKAKPIMVEDAKVMFLNKKTNQFEEVGVEVLPKGTEYFLRLDGKKQLGIVSSAGFAEGDVRPLSKLWKYVIADPHYRMGKQVDAAFTTGSSIRDVLSHNLTHSQKSFFNLNNSSKQVVAALIEQGRVEKKVFDWQTLAGRGVDEKEIVAYYAQRRLYDSLYAAKNEVLRRDLVAEGYKSITSGAFTTAARPITDIAGMSAVKEYYDPVLKTVVKITSSQQAKRLLESGHSFGFLKKDIFRGEDAYKHILIRPTDSIDELPKFLLHYRVGHAATYYTDPFYVVKQVPGQKDIVVATSTSRKAAKEHANNMQEALLREGREGKVVHRVANEYDTGKTLYDKELQDHTLDLWFEPKSPDLVRITGEVAPIADALEATQRVIAEFSSRVGLHEVVDSMTANLKKMYPKFWEGDTYIGHSKSDATSMELRRSNSVYDRIEVFKRTPTAGEKTISAIFQELDKLLNYIPGKTVSELSGKLLVAGASRTSPARLATNLAGSVEIALSPVKQALLNIATIPHIAAMDPVAGAKALREFNFVFTAALLKHAGKDYSLVTKAAKVAGIDPVELKNTVDAFLSTGKLAGVDANVVLSEVSFATNKELANNIASKTWGILSQSYKVPVKFFRKVGIDAGESYYQAFLFSFEKERFMKANPGTDPFANLHTIQKMAAEGRAIGYDMTLSGRLPYQRGLFAPITQFLAMSHKAALSLTDALVNTSGRLSKQERAYYVAGNALLGGLAGLGLGARNWEGIKEWAGISNIPPELDNILRGGFADFAGNYAMYLAFQEKDMPRSTIAEVLSPNSRAWTFASNIYKTLFLPNNKSFIEKAMAASGKDVGNLGKYLSDLYLMWGWNGVGYTDTQDALLTTMKQTASWVRPVGDLIKYQCYLGIKNATGESKAISTEKKSFMYDYLESEAFLQTFLGMKPAIGWAYEKLNADSKDFQDEVKSGAAQIWRLMHDELSSEYSPATVEKVGRFMNTISKGDPTIKYYLDKELLSLLQNQKETKMDGLMLKIMDYHGLGGSKNAFDYAVDQMKNLPPEERKALKDGRDKMYKSLVEDTEKTNAR